MRRTRWLRSNCYHLLPTTHTHQSPAIHPTHQHHIRPIAFICNKSAPIVVCDRRWFLRCSPRQRTRTLHIIWCTSRALYSGGLSGYIHTLTCIPDANSHIFCVGQRLAQFLKSKTNTIYVYMAVYGGSDGSTDLYGNRIKSERRWVFMLERKNSIKKKILIGLIRTCKTI